LLRNAGSIREQLKASILEEEEATALRQALSTIEAALDGLN
jgi:hypothetical protein